MSTRSKKSRVICESNQIIEASHELTMAEFNVMYSFLSTIYQREEEVVSTKFCNIPVEMYAERYKMTRTAAYKVLKEVALTFMKKTLIYKEAIFKEGSNYTTMTLWVQAISYDSNTSSLSIKWADSILPFLSVFEDSFAQHDLEVLCSFKSVYSLRLYRLLNQYDVSTSRLWELSAFRDAIGLATKYNTFDMLRSKVIEPALVEVNRETGWKVSVQYKRRGRKVVGIRFILNHKLPKLEETVI